MVFANWDIPDPIDGGSHAFYFQFLIFTFYFLMTKL